MTDNDFLRLEVERLMRERDEALEWAKECACNAEINRLRVETLERGDESFKIRAQAQETINGWKARAEAAERERDEARDQRDCREHEKTALRNCLKQAESDLDVAEAKVAKLREGLTLLLEWYDKDGSVGASYDHFAHARTILQETEQ